MYDILSGIWCKDTCAARMRDDWTPENKTLGQCSITAFLVQDVFGGEVRGIPLKDGGIHCYNVVGGCTFDLTSEQFKDEVLSYADNPLQSREVHFADTDKRRRYYYLKTEFDKYIRHNADKVQPVKPPELTTLCYIESDGKYLMLHRVKKQNDINKDKYLGVGGHFMPGESPEDCLLREVLEETGLTLTSYRARGIVTFIYSDKEFDTFEQLKESGSYITEYMHLYTSDAYTGEITECDEGELVWIDKDKVYDLPIWEGDKVFFKLLENEDRFFSLKLVYSKDRLIFQNAVIS